MARYFQSIVTGRPLQVGGRSFIFEPVEPMGGSWTGVLAVDEASAASVLADAGGSVWEIPFEKFDELKKKRSGVETPRALKPLQMPQLPPQPLVLDASRAANPINSRGNEAQPVISEKPVASVELKTTTAQPPPEPLLDMPAPKRKKAA